MGEVVRPERLESDPNRSVASKEWNHWKITFDNILLQINLISLCHKSCAGEHPLYLHSFGTSLDNGK